MKALMRIVISEMLYLWWVTAGIIIILITAIVFDSGELMQHFSFLKAKNLSVFLIFIYLMAYNTNYIFENRKSFFQRLPIIQSLKNLDRVITSIIYVFLFFFIQLIAKIINSDFSNWTVFEFISLQAVFVLIMSFFTMMNSNILDKEKDYPVFSNFGSMLLVISATIIIYGVLFSKDYLFCFVEPKDYYIQSLVMLAVSLVLFMSILFRKK